MRQKKQKRSFTSMVVIFCLLFSIVCSSITPFYASERAHSAIILKKPATSSKSDSQLPEKVESENDYKPHGSFVLIHSIGSIVRIDVVNLLERCFTSHTRFRAISYRLPLYLAKRVIII